MARHPRMWSSTPRVLRDTQIVQVIIISHVPGPSRVSIIFSHSGSVGGGAGGWPTAGLMMHISAASLLRSVSIAVVAPAEQARAKSGLEVADTTAP